MKEVLVDCRQISPCFINNAYGSDGENNPIYLFDGLVAQWGTSAFFKSIT